MTINKEESIKMSNAGQKEKWFNSKLKAFYLWQIDNIISAYILKYIDWTVILTINGIEM